MRNSTGSPIFSDFQSDLSRVVSRPLVKGNEDAGYEASSETQGQSVGSGEKARRKFFSSGEGAPGYRLSPDHFQKFKRMPAPDWAQKYLCIIVPNQRTASPEFFSCVRTRLLLSRHTCLVRSPRLCVQFAREICPFCFPKQKRRSYR